MKIKTEYVERWHKPKLELRRKFRTLNVYFENKNDLNKWSKTQT